MVVPAAAAAAAAAALTTIGVDALLLDVAFVLAADTTCTLVSPAGTVDKRRSKKLISDEARSRAFFLSFQRFSEELSERI